MACPIDTKKPLNSSDTSTCPVSSASPSFPASVPESLTAASWLLGKWTTNYSKSCPFRGMRDFEFGEDLYFTCHNQPIICYRNRSWKADGSKLMHHEAGFLRIKPQESASPNLQQHVAFSLAFSHGDVEILEGNLERNRLELESAKIEATSFQHTSPVTKTKRIYSYDEDTDTLTFQHFMATTKVPEITKHIHAVYKRSDDKSQ